MRSSSVAGAGAPTNTTRTEKSRKELLRSVIGIADM